MGLAHAAATSHFIVGSHIFVFVEQYKSLKEEGGGLRRLIYTVPWEMWAVPTLSGAHVERCIVEHFQCVPARARDKPKRRSLDSVAYRK